MIHPTAEVSESARIGRGTEIWHYCQVREQAIIGQNCILGKGVYVDHDVEIGNNCKIQNGANIYYGAILEDGVFVGPGAILANDPFPRAINSDGSLKGASDWKPGRIYVERGASIGAGAIILPNITIGAFAMVGAGAVVTGDVTSYGKVTGNPARLVGYVERPDD